MTDEVRIFIVAGNNCGKTTIAAILGEALQAKGFTNIEIIDLPPSSDDKEPITKRFEVARRRPVKIQVVKEELKLCAQCHYNPVAYPGAEFCGPVCSQSYAISILLKD